MFPSICNRTNPPYVTALDLASNLNSPNDSISVKRLKNSVTVMVCYVKCI